MNDDQPTQRLTDTDIEDMRDWYNKVRDHRVGALLAEVDRIRAELYEAHRTVSAEEGRAAALEAVYRQTCTERDVRSAEIERLRAENDRLCKQVQDYHKSADEHTAKFDRQHERLMQAEDRIAAARKALFDDAFEGHAQRYRALAKALGDTDE